MNFKNKTTQNLDKHSRYRLRSTAGSLCDLSLQPQPWLLKHPSLNPTLIQVSLELKAFPNANSPITISASLKSPQLPHIDISKKSKLCTSVTRLWAIHPDFFFFF